MQILIVINTIYIGTNRQFTSLQLILGNDEDFPQFLLNPLSEKNSLYHKMLEIRNDKLSGGSFMNLKTFSEIYPFIYFYSTKQKNLLGSFPI